MPLQKLAPQKGPLKNIRSRAYFQNFTVALAQAISEALEFNFGHKKEKMVLSLPKKEFEPAINWKTITGQLRT